MRENLRISYDEIYGAITPPPSKSYSQRYVLMASFLPGKKFITPVGHSDDEKVALEIACAALKHNFLFPETGDVSKSYPDFFQHMQSIGFSIMQQEE